MKTKDLLPVALDQVALECRDMEALGSRFRRMKTVPVWPDEPGAQKQMACLDFVMRSREQFEFAVARATECGASKARTQYSQEQWYPD